MEKSLHDLRILDFTWVLAGPFATRILSDHGAEVIKVQSALTMEPDHQNNSNYFLTWNRNKRGISLNLQSHMGIDLVKKLVQLSDVVIENFSPRVMSNWGLGYDVISNERPDIIMLSMSGMGHSGPWTNFTAFGPTIQAFSGITELTSFPDQPPAGLGFSYADHIAGLTASLAILEALEYRHLSGKGQFIDLSEFESMASLMGPTLLDYSVNSKITGPCGNRSVNGGAAPHSIYACKGDDRWCAISVTTEEEWECFRQALGNPLWTRDKRFDTHLNRCLNADILDKHVEEWTKGQHADEVMQKLQDLGIAAGVVQNGSDLSRDVQLHSRDFFTEIDHPLLGKTFADKNPIRLSETPDSIQQPAPILGQDNEYVFLELMGMSMSDYNQYRSAGIIN